MVTEETELEYWYDDVLREYDPEEAGEIWDGTDID